MILCRLFSKKKQVSKTPHRRQYETLDKCFTCLMWIIALICIPLFIYVLFSPCLQRYIPCLVPDSSDSIYNSPRSLITLISVCIGIITYLFTAKSKIKVLAEEEEAQVTLFNSELKDFIRHLQANLRVLIRIKEELDKGKGCVQNIHFENLKWPESSCLLSNKMATLVDTGKKGCAFFQLELRIRNLNNSADWLKEVNSSGKMTKEFLEYEIDRHVRLILETEYMNSTKNKPIGKNYRIPDSKNEFIEKKFCGSIEKCFKVGYMEDEKEEGTKELIERQKKNKVRKRVVLVS